MLTTVDPKTYDLAAAWLRDERYPTSSDRDQATSELASRIQEAIEDWQAEALTGDLTAPRDASGRVVALPQRVLAVRPDGPWRSNHDNTTGE
jgi:hypothetical protein